MTTLHIGRVDCIDIQQRTRNLFVAQSSKDGTFTIFDREATLGGAEYRKVAVGLEREAADGRLTDEVSLLTGGSSAGVSIFADPAPDAWIVEAAEQTKEPDLT